MCSRKVAVTVFMEMCSASFFREIKMYSQRNIVKNSVGTDRGNTVPENLNIIWKLNEAWPQLLKLLKLKKNSITALQLLRFLILKNGLRHFLTTFKVTNADIALHHILMTLKVFSKSYSVECWLIAVSEGQLSYDIYIKELDLL